MDRRDDFYGNRITREGYGDRDTYSFYRDDYSYQDYGQNYERAGAEVDWTSVVAGTLLTVLGGYLIYRGVSSQGARSGLASYSGYQQRERGRGIEVEESVTINKLASELYSYWHNFENLPNIMTYLESVTDLGGGRSHWVAKGPAGRKIEWDAQLVDDRENELISWRSSDDTAVPNEGSVQFEEASGGLGTKVTVYLTYHPPGGALGAAVARMFGREPSQQIREDLNNFKEHVESGTLTLGSDASSNF